MILVLFIASPLPFIASPPDTTHSAVPFETTKPTGLSDRIVERARTSSLVIPKAEVYYAQYRYVVGYYGITTLVAGLDSNQQREFGAPLTVFVTDFSGTGVHLGSDGYLRMDQSESTEWIPARKAYFVVNSSGRVPTRSTTVVPFSTRSDAQRFARQHGGSVKRWAAVKGISIGRPGRTVQTWQRVVNRRTRRASNHVQRARELLDRPTSVIVRANTTSIAAAIEEAPPNTTVILPPGTYDVDEIQLSKPITIRGAGPNATHISGDDNGSVITATARKTAIVGVSISGVGDDRSGAGEQVGNISVNRTSWKYRYYKVHGYGDAAIVFDDAGASLVASVRINTTSNGILSRSSSNVVITNLTLYGTKLWEKGFL
ncbi:MAG: nitrous oxide reductase accessory protein NosL, partial [Halobacteriaceae archaeon]